MLTRLDQLTGTPKREGMDRTAAVSTAEKRVREAVDARGLSDLANLALMEIVKDPHGLERTAAASYVASLTNFFIESCQQAIIDLLAENLLLSISADRPRLVANYELIGIDETLRSELIQRALPFQNLGPPHSPKAMTTLDDLFVESADDIYLGLEVTSPEVFTKLGERARRNRRTVFFMPRKKHVREERQVHYDEVLKAWMERIKRERVLRRHVEIRTTPTPYPHIYTSGLSSSEARLDVYPLSARSTREGEIVRVESDSSMYRLVRAEYERAAAESAPLVRLWPWRWGQFYLQKYFLAVAVLLGSILGWKVGGPTHVLGAVLLGIVSQGVYEFLRSDRLRKKFELFPRR